MSRRRKVTEEEEPDFDALLDDVYYNEETGYLSAQKLSRRLRDFGYKVPLKKIKEWLSKQPDYVETTTAVQPKVFNSVVADTVGSNYQMDIMYMKNYPSHGYLYIILVVDVHSRYLGCAALKTRTADEYTKAFKTIIREQMDGIFPIRLTCDGEFIAGKFQRVAYNKFVDGVTITDRGQPYKNAIVERMVRTIRTLIGRWRAGARNGGGVFWSEVLEAIRNNYNNTYHRTIKQKPVDVWLGHKSNNQVIRWVPNQLHVGAQVRVAFRNLDKKWSKVDDSKWSDDIYVLIEEVGARWKLGAIPGGREPPEGLYMEYELKLVPGDSRQRPSHSKSLVNAQKANAAAARRLRKEDLGNLGEDIGGRPTFTQLIISGNRTRRAPERFVPGK